MQWVGIVQNQSCPSFSHPNDIIGRQCRVNVSGRWKGLKLVRDGVAVDCVTGITARSGGWKSENGAKKHALEELCKMLHAHFEPIRAAERARQERERLEQQLRQQAEALRRLEVQRAEQQRQAEAMAARQRQQQADALRREQEAQQRHAAEMEIQRQAQQLQLQERLRVLREQLNDKVANYDVKHNHLLSLNAQIDEEEKRLATFEVERNNEDTKMIVVLGWTGDGKSTFGNRLAGDTSLFGKQGPFGTSANGQSCTQQNTRTLVNINGHTIAVVDTPGFGDTFGRDREHGNMLCRYLKGCGGINNIILIRNAANVRFDNGFQRMLERYHEMMGNIFFELLIIVATRVDSRINKMQFEENNQADLLRRDICDKFNLNIQIPVIPIGLESYEESINSLVQAISNNKREFDCIKSPIDEWKEQRTTAQAQDRAAQEEVERVCTEINSVEQSLQALST